MKKKIMVNDKMQRDYVYYLTEPIGKNFHRDFDPSLTPKEMLFLGVFGGKYLTDCEDEFPKDWFKKAKLSPQKRDPEINFFRVNASRPLSLWREKGWIYYEDPRGWFQWYCRYYLGRRIEKEDERQIRRWRAFKRHWSAVEKNCRKSDFTCRPKQKQALMHWAYDSRKL